MESISKTGTKILQLLKRQGAMTAKTLSGELNMTTMGVRQHLQMLEDQGEVFYEDHKAQRGRPTRYWSLTIKSNEHFEDRHEELTLKLIDSVQAVFGESGVDQLIQHREMESEALYSAKLQAMTSLFDKLTALAELRSTEGYMAEIHQENGDYWLIENHCPICSAAKHCMKFCRSELQLFQSLLRGFADVRRDEHIINGDRRCAYKITPSKTIG